MNKRKQLIFDLCKYYNYPSLAKIPDIDFDYSYIKIELSGLRYSLDTLFDYSYRINCLLKEIGINNITINCINRYTLIVKGLDTEEKADQIYCLLKLKGILK